jgi:hypothetical protein
MDVRMSVRHAGKDMGLAGHARHRIGRSHKRTLPQERARVSSFIWRVRLLELAVQWVGDL